MKLRFLEVEVLLESGLKRCDKKTHRIEVQRKQKVGLLI